jgi:hypothetical protein
MSVGAFGEFGVVCGLKTSVVEFSVTKCVSPNARPYTFFPDTSHSDQSLIYSDIFELEIIYMVLHFYFCSFACLLLAEAQKQSF